MQSDDESEDASADESMDVDDGAVQQSEDDILAKKLVRYALSCEYARIPIRRDGVKERGTPSILNDFRMLTVLSTW